MRKKVVIVEDNRPLRNQLVKVINHSKNYECLDHFGNAELALQIIPKLKPDLVLMDIELPKMDGIEVLQAIKKDDHLKNIPVVMLTSSREEPDLNKCYALGVNAYVVKPVHFKDFFEIVKCVGVFWALVNELLPEERNNY